MHLSVEAPRQEEWWSLAEDFHLAPTSRGAGAELSECAALRRFRVRGASGVALRHVSWSGRCIEGGRAPESGLGRGTGSRTPAR